MKAHSVTLPEPEWSFLIDVDDVRAGEKSWVISPNAQQRTDLAARLEVVSIEDIKADVTVEQDGPHLFYVQGSFTAKITQECVITLEPIVCVIEDQFEAWFSEQEKLAHFKKAQQDARIKKENIELPILDEKDDPEPVIHGKIDIGEVVTQFVSLAINPYPQKEGAQLPESVRFGGGDEKVVSDKLERPNPFAALKNWRPKD
jgi:uncharacterized metal-binding protein YceD (DUF177 family)